ncbi:hypothetical protein KZX46_21885 (plasmid) [Polymorphobacter sp. PAMC 29334]|uniref:hypothetical protein n=1 Tax=Polymorphobacter sp. PAMC 29334 TaxID=2862331 RepID=UPI001C75A0B9|nr:hypothetical protein [Polymorphobacter sp. PAMC 29334]QYE37052.1 hypothetical protein KZX46_21885 [Polymorphobacter sp. PAMC 29334]
MIDMSGTLQIAGCVQTQLAFPDITPTAKDRHLRKPTYRLRAIRLDDAGRKEPAPVFRTF